LLVVAWGGQFTCGTPYDDGILLCRVPHWFHALFQGEGPLFPFTRFFHFRVFVRSTPPPFRPSFVVVVPFFFFFLASFFLQVSLKPLRGFFGFSGNGLSWSSHSLGLFFEDRKQKNLRSCRPGPLFLQKITFPVRRLLPRRSAPPWLLDVVYS